MALRLDAVHDRAAELDLECRVVEGRAYVALELFHDLVVDLFGRLVELHVHEADLAVLADATALAGVRVTDADDAWYLARRLPGGLDVLARSVAGQGLVVGEDDLGRVTGALGELLLEQVDGVLRLRPGDGELVNECAAEQVGGQGHGDERRDPDDQSAHRVTGAGARECCECARPVKWILG